MTLRLRDLIPDVDVLLSLAPEELVFQMLKLAKAHLEAPYVMTPVARDTYFV
jgi:hypothetical protein